MRRLLVVSAFVTLSLVTLPAAASDTEVVLYQDNEVTVVEDGNWVEWRFEDSLSGAKEHIYRGKRERGGACSFSMSTTVSPAPAGSYNAEREIASNLTDCLMVTETGLVVTETGLATAADAPSDTTLTKEFIPAVGGGGGGGIGIAATKRVWYKIVLNDPPNLELVSDMAEVSFAYNGTCVTNSWDHIANWYNKWWWNRSSEGGSATRICSYAETDTYSHFFNDSVCSGPRTWGHFYEVKVRGHEGGGQTNHKNIWKTGGCSDLLHWDFASS